MSSDSSFEEVVDSSKDQAFVMVAQPDTIDLERAAQAGDWDFMTRDDVSDSTKEMYKDLVKKSSALAKKVLKYEMKMKTDKYPENGIATAKWKQAHMDYVSSVKEMIAIQKRLNKTKQDTDAKSD